MLVKFRDIWPKQTKAVHPGIGGIRSIDVLYARSSAFGTEILLLSAILPKMPQNNHVVSLKGKQKHLKYHIVGTIVVLFILFFNILLQLYSNRNILLSINSILIRLYIFISSAFGAKILTSSSLHFHLTDVHSCTCEC